MYRTLNAVALNLTARFRRDDVQRRAGSSSRLTEDRHGVRITTEIADVEVDPAQSEVLVVQTVVAWRYGVFRCQETFK